MKAKYAILRDNEDNGYQGKPWYIGNPHDMTDIHDARVALRKFRRNYR